MFKRKYLISLGLLLVAALWLAFFAPQRLLKAEADVEYIRCAYYSDEQPSGEYLSLTEAQAAGLLEILQPLWRFRVWGESSYSLEEVTLEISLLVDKRPLYIVLGRRDYCYDGALGPFQQFDIIGADEATEQILALLGVVEDRGNGRQS